MRLYTVPTALLFKPFLDEQVLPFPALFQLLKVADLSVLLVSSCHSVL